MSDDDPDGTQVHSSPTPDAELTAEGFDDVQVIGRGGFGTVYRCVQRELDRPVAVKFLTTDLDAENLARFLREQRAMGRLSGHPNIVPIFDVGTAPSGRPYLVMQLHARGSLDDLIRRSGPLEWPKVLQLGVKLCGALEYAHRAGIVHRDVKPANVLLTDYGEPQLTDFGIARVAGGFETSTGKITGSPAFTAPEVLRGQTPGPTADVYGVGATLFCALTGHAAYERREGERIVTQFLRMTSDPIPDLRGGAIPDEVCAVLEHAMAAEVVARPADARQLGEELREVQRLTGVPVDPLPLPQPDSAPSPTTVSPPAATERTGAWTPTLTSPGRQTAPPIPATRFRPPESARSQIPRTKALELLRAGGDRRLIFLHAPTGYGKSILAAQWRRILGEERVPVGWLTVDGDDNNPVWLLTHIVDAIGRVRPDVTHNLRQQLEEHGLDVVRQVLAAVIDRIHDSGHRMMLMLDDWHRVTVPEAHAVVRTLLDEGCHHLQLLVTSRTRAGLPLGRLRVRDELVELDSATLRFDSVEAEQFLLEVGGLHLTAHDVTTLTDTTDGWVAGLQLASLTLRGRADPSTLIDRITGRTQAIGEFLAENVLDSLDPAVLDFVLATSVSERLCGSLATALSGDPHGQAMLEKVEELDLFLRRSDEGGQWFTYHHLFAEFLRHRLERDTPDRATDLHRIAARWFADHDLLSDAVDHALAAGDRAGAVQLVEDNGMTLLEHARMSTVLGLIDKLPSVLVWNSLRLQLILAWANNELLRAEPARRARARAEELLATGSRPPEETARLRAELGVVTAESLLFRDRVAGIAPAVADCLAAPGSQRPWVVSAASGIAAYGSVYSFDFAAAREIERWAAPYHERANGPYSVVWGQCISGIAANEQLEVGDAERHFRQAYRIAVDEAGPHSHVARLAAAVLGEFVYEHGDTAQAARLLDESAALGTTGGVDFMVPPFVIGARILALGGDPDGAQERLNEGQRIAAELDLPRLRAHIAAERVRLHLRDTRCALPDCASVVPDTGRQPQDGVARIVGELEEAAYIMYLLARTPQRDPAQACSRARRLVGTVAGTGRERALLHARRLLLGCLVAEERADEAARLLADVAAHCAELGILRVLVDGGPPLDAALVEPVVGAATAGRWPEAWTVVPMEFLSALREALASS